MTQGLGEGPGRQTESKGWEAREALEFSGEGGQSRTSKNRSRPVADRWPGLPGACFIDQRLDGACMSQSSVKAWR